MIFGHFLNILEWFKIYLKLLKGDANFDLKNQKLFEMDKGNYEKENEEEKGEEEEENIDGENVNGVKINDDIKK
jgi:hypothetical protein